MGGRTSSGSRWTESRESRSPSNRRGIVSVAAPLAQWIEHLPSKQRVGGSNPSRGAIFVSSVRFCAQIHVSERRTDSGNQSTPRPARKRGSRLAGQVRPRVEEARDDRGRHRPVGEV